MANEIKVHGLKELNKALMDMPGVVRNKVLVGALRAAAKPIHEDAQARISYLTGRTLGDLKIRKFPEGKIPPELGDAAVTIAGSTRKKGRAYIMRFLEFGTAKMAARPFLRPAADSNVGASIQTFGKAAWKRLKYQMKKFKRR